MDIEARTKLVNKAPGSRGKTCILKHLSGEKLTQRQAIIGKCCDCMAYNTDGRIDCQMPHCTLYPWMPYRKDKPERKISGRKGNPDALRKAREARTGGV